MTTQDKELLEIAMLHKTCLSDSHIGRLPTWMVIKFYKNIYKHDDFELFLHREDQKVIGVAVISKKGFGATKSMLPLIAYFLFILKNPIQVLKSLINSTKSMETLSDINIEFLFVNSTYRSGGIGSKLLQSVKDKYSVICVSTRNSIDNKAINFYVRNGFKPIGNQVLIGSDLKIYKWKA